MDCDIRRFQYYFEYIFLRNACPTKVGRSQTPLFCTGMVLASGTVWGIMHRRYIIPVLVVGYSRARAIPDTPLQDASRDVGDLISRS